MYEHGLQVLKEISTREASHPDGALNLTKYHEYGKSGFVVIGFGDSSDRQVLMKDHQGSVMMAVYASNGAVVKEQGYRPYGGLEKRVVPGSDLAPSETYTGKEFDDPTNLYYFGARFFDPDLSAWLTPDPMGQFYDPYAFGSNPVNGVDKDGRCIDGVSTVFCAVAIGAAIGAVIGGTTAYVAYGSSTGNWALNDGDTWAAVGKGAAVGAVSGAITGGFGSLGTSVATNVAWSAMGNVTSYTATTLGSQALGWGGELSAGGYAGAIGGGLFGGLFPGVQAVEGGALKNGVNEIAFSAAKGFVIGGVGGGLGAAIDGKDIGSGVSRGAIQGAAGGAMGAGLKIGLYGTTRMGPIEIGKMEEAEGAIGADQGGYGAVSRRGGLYAIVSRGWGISIGRNAIAPSSNQDLHEHVHHIQQIKQGIVPFYIQGANEQWRWKGEQEVYVTPGTNEYQAYKLSE